MPREWAGVNFQETELPSQGVDSKRFPFSSARLFSISAPCGRFTCISTLTMVCKISPWESRTGPGFWTWLRHPPDVESQTFGSRFPCPPTWLVCNQCQLLLQVRVRSGTHTVPSSGPGFATYYLHDFMEVAPSFEPYFCQLKIEISWCLLISFLSLLWPITTDVVV